MSFEDHEIWREDGEDSGQIAEAGEKATPKAS